MDKEESRAQNADFQCHCIDMSILVIQNENMELFLSSTWSFTSRFGVL